MIILTDAEIIQTLMFCSQDTSPCSHCLLGSVEGCMSELMKAAAHRMSVLKITNERKD